MWAERGRCLKNEQPSRRRRRRSCAWKISMGCGPIYCALFISATRVGLVDYMFLFTYIFIFNFNFFVFVCTGLGALLRALILCARGRLSKRTDPCNDSVRFEFVCSCWHALSSAVAFRCVPRPQASGALTDADDWRHVVIIPSSRTYLAESAIFRLG